MTKGRLLLIGCAAGLAVFSLFFVALLAGGAGIGVLMLQEQEAQAELDAEQAEIEEMAELLAEYWRAFCKVPDLPATADRVPSNGVPVLPEWSNAWTDTLQFEPRPGASRFRYRVAREGHRLTVFSEADFQPGGPVHEASVVVVIAPDCSANVGTMTVRNAGQ